MTLQRRSDRFVVSPTQPRSTEKVSPIVASPKGGQVPNQSRVKLARVLSAMMSKPRRSERQARRGSVKFGRIQRKPDFSLPEYARWIRTQANNSMTANPHDSKPNPSQQEALPKPANQSSWFAPSHVHISWLTWLFPILATVRRPPWTSSPSWSR